MNYTLAVTSCHRFDLLKRTLESFAATADIAPTETIIVDDSCEPMPAWMAFGLPGLGNVRWISNGRRRGQIFTLDRLYDEIKTELVFHTEDDWQYGICPLYPIIHTSFGILEQHPHIWSVSLRGDDCNGHPVILDGATGLALNEPGWREGWGGMSFNPGARRMYDYRRIGSYGRHVGYGTHGCGHELELSKMHLAMGYRIAALPKSIEHLGAGKSKAIEPLPPQPHTLIAVPVAQRYEYGNHTLRVERVTDGRVAAVRETWFKDAEKFPNVDAKFFYGRPVRGWDGDEVFVNALDDYAGLSHKVKEVCRYALAHDYEHLVKADDDSVLYIDRLLRSGFDSVDQMGYFGCGHPPGRCSCYATGMCYTLSRRAMELVVAAQVTHWAEDLWVGSVLRQHGIRPVHNPGFVPGFDDHYVKFPLPPATVAAHSVRPADMRLWHEGLYRGCTGLVDAGKGLL